MKLKPLLLAFLCVLTITSAALAQYFTRLSDEDGAPINGANPLSVDASVTVTSLTTLGTITNPVGLKGVDGAAIATTTNALPVTPGGIAQASITNTNTAIPAVSTQVTLGTAASHIRIKNNSDTETLYVDLTNGAATSADYAILPLEAMEPYDGAPITLFKVLGTNANDTYNVLAW